MRIVVTGALGHIGSSLIRALPDRFPGAKIVMIDNLSTQRYPSLFNLPAKGDYAFFEEDIMTAELETRFSGASVVVHLAGITDATSSFEHSDEVLRVNADGARRVAKACLASKCPMIFPSTTSVYGVQAEWVDEDCPREGLKPQSPYADSKLQAEQMLCAMGGQFALDFITFRFGTIFGVSPGMRFHTVVNKFCWQSVLGQPLTIWRTAMHQMRPYLDLQDCIQAIMFAIERRIYDKRIYNVVTLNASVADITETIRNDVPDLRVQYVDTPIMNQLSYRVSGQRFQSLGFKYSGDLQRGIKDTIGMLRAIRGDKDRSRVE